MNARGRPAATAKGGLHNNNHGLVGWGLSPFVYIYIHRLHKLITISMEEFYEYFALHLLPLVQILK